MFAACLLGPSRVFVIFPPHLLSRAAAGGLLKHSANLDVTRPGEHRRVPAPVLRCAISREQPIWLKSDLPNLALANQVS
jgi:hypothetical protein